jgi:hypothetical protein
MDEHRINFAYAAINDCQSTIRAIDVKLGALLTAIFLPLGVIDKIWGVFVSFKNSFSTYFPDIAIFIFFMLWLLVVVALIRTLAAIDNPKTHISSYAEHSGSFYNGGEFEIRVIDIWFNRKSICSKSQVTQLATRYPQDSNILSELAFEHLKLIYIRDIKLYRLKNCFYGVLLWGLLGVCIFLVTRMS